MNNSKSSWIMNKNVLGYLVLFALIVSSLNVFAQSAPSGDSINLTTVPGLQDKQQINDLLTAIVTDSALTLDQYSKIALGVQANIRRHWHVNFDAQAIWHFRNRADAEKRKTPADAQKWEDSFNEAFGEFTKIETNPNAKVRVILKLPAAFVNEIHGSLAQLPQAFVEYKAIKTQITYDNVRLPTSATTYVVITGTYDLKVGANEQIPVTVNVGRQRGWEPVTVVSGNALETTSQTVRVSQTVTVTAGDNKEVEFSYRRGSFQQARIQVIAKDENGRLLTSAAPPVYPNIKLVEIDNGVETPVATKANEISDLYAVDKTYKVYFEGANGYRTPATTPAFVLKTDKEIAGVYTKLDFKYTDQDIKAISESNSKVKVVFPIEVQNILDMGADPTTLVPNPTNFRIQGLTVLGANVEADKKTIILTTTPQQEIVYELSIITKTGTIISGQPNLAFTGKIGKYDEKSEELVTKIDKDGNEIKEKLNIAVRVDPEPRADLWVKSGDSINLNAVVVSNNIPSGSENNLKWNWTATKPGGEIVFSEGQGLTIAPFSVTDTKDKTGNWEIKLKVWYEYNKVSETESVSGWWLWKKTTSSAETEAQGLVVSENTWTYEVREDVKDLEQRNTDILTFITAGDQARTAATTFLDQARAQIKARTFDASNGAEKSINDAKAQKDIAINKYTVAKQKADAHPILDPVTKTKIKTALQEMQTTFAAKITEVENELTTAKAINPLKIVSSPKNTDEIGFTFNPAAGSIPSITPEISVATIPFSNTPSNEEAYKRVVFSWQQLDLQGNSVNNPVEDVLMNANAGTVNDAAARYLIKEVKNSYVKLTVKDKALGVDLETYTWNVNVPEQWDIKLEALPADKPYRKGVTQFVITADPEPEPQNPKEYTWTITPVWKVKDASGSKVNFDPSSQHAAKLELPPNEEAEKYTVTVQAHRTNGNVDLGTRNVEVVVEGVTQDINELTKAVDQADAVFLQGTQENDKVKGKKLIVKAQELYTNAKTEANSFYTANPATKGQALTLIQQRIDPKLAEIKKFLDSPLTIKTSATSFVLGSPDKLTFKAMKNTTTAYAANEVFWFVDPSIDAQIDAKPGNEAAAELTVNENADPNKKLTVTAKLESNQLVYDSVEVTLSKKAATSITIEPKTINLKRGAANQKAVFRVTVEPKDKQASLQINVPGGASVQNAVISNLDSDPDPNVFAIEIKDAAPVTKGIIVSARADNLPEANAVLNILADNDAELAGRDENGKALNFKRISGNIGYDNNDAAYVRVLNKWYKVPDKVTPELYLLYKEIELR